MTTSVRLLPGALLLMLAACGADDGDAPATAADANPAGQLLASPYGELCTMCEGYLQCRSGGAHTGFTLYHVETKDFWQQIATIGDWFMYVFRERRDEQRRLTIYTEAQGADGKTVRVILPDHQAQLSLQRARINVPGGWIDRRTGTWQREGADEPGQCAALPTPEARALLSRFGVPGE